MGEKKKSVKNEKNILTQRVKNKGITLVALVVTIIVLLILAGVSISLLIGKNGILSQAKKAKEETIKTDEKEAVLLAYASCKANNMMDRVTDKQLQQELKNNGRDITVTTITENELEVVFNDTKHVYIVDKNGSTEEYVQSKKDMLYAMTYCNEILAYARNPSKAEELSSRYRKYFDVMRIENREEFLKLHAKAVSNSLLGYARNPSLDNWFIENLKKLTYEGEISQKNYTPAVQAAYLKNTGAFMLAYARNPGLCSNFSIKISERNPYVTATSQGDNVVNGTTYDKGLEEVKGAREEILGDYLLAYARNPSLNETLLLKLNELSGINKNANPSVKEQIGATRAVGKVLLAFARNPSLETEIFEYFDTESSGIKDKNLEEIQIARAETLELLIAAMTSNTSLMTQMVDYYNKYTGEALAKSSPRVQAISLYNTGGLFRAPGMGSGVDFTELINNYDKADINITENTEEIQAASLATLGELYWAAPFVEETTRKSMIDFYKTKLYKKPTSNSPLIQAAQYYCDGYYDSAYQKIMKITDEQDKVARLKILEDIKKEFSSHIKINYLLEEVQLARIEILNDIYTSFWTGAKIRRDVTVVENPREILEPSEEYFKRGQVQGNVTENIP